MFLDGKEKIKPVPFDAHDQVVHAPHVHGKDGYEKVGEAPAASAVDSPDSAHVHPQGTEYPKVVGYDKETKEPIIAQSAEHETKLSASDGDEGTGEPAPVVKGTAKKSARW
jgi:hypothetical protein